MVPSVFTYIYLMFTHFFNYHSMAMSQNATSGTLKNTWLMDGSSPSHLVDWIGLRENLQETMIFTIKYEGFLYFFP